MQDLRDSLRFSGFNIVSVYSLRVKEERGKRGNVGGEEGIEEDRRFGFKAKGSVAGVVNGIRIAERFLYGEGRQGIG